MHKQIESAIRERFDALYGDKPHLLPYERFKREEAVLERSDTLLLLGFLGELRKQAAQRDEEILLRGALGASFWAYLAGATDVNPLPPHYRCPACGYFEAVEGNIDGWDLPPKICSCGAEMVGDGHGLAFESLLPTLCDRNTHEVSVSAEFRPIAEAAFYAYFEGRQIAEVAFEGNEEHPGLYVIEAGYKVPTQPLEFGAFLAFLNHAFGIRFVTTQYLSRLPRMAKACGVHAADVPYTEAGLVDEFAADRVDGIPDYEVEQVRAVLRVIPPSSFYELVRVPGFAHGTWKAEVDGVGRHSPADFGRFAFRDELYFDLLQRQQQLGISGDGFVRAFTRRTRRGLCCSRGIPPAMVAALQQLECDDTYAEELRQIYYLFPKAHAVAYVRLALIMMWYKKHAPAAFSKVMHG